MKRKFDKQKSEAAAGDAAGDERSSIGLSLERRRAIAAEMLGGRDQHRPDLTPETAEWLTALGFGHCLSLNGAPSRACGLLMKQRAPRPW
jgi:hypothetical protein